MAKLIILITFLSNILITPARPMKGLAMLHPEYQQDLTSLSISWFYVWGVDQSYLKDSRYVPMSRCGEVVTLPKGYSGYLLVFNEPNNAEPNGCGISPAVAIKRYKVLVAAFPKAKMVVGAVSAWDSVYAGSWLKTFVSQVKSNKLPIPYAYALHGYREQWITVNNLESWWTGQQKITGTKIWITEYGDLGGNLANVKALTTWLQTKSWVERYAIFTNRSDDESYSIGHGVDLIDWNKGSLTPTGVYYAGIK
ncbi:MAG: glycosyl hydrolase [Anaerolineaceae bacterium]|nr:glycosyl hydrolase [Anaerolineaceae bacterium]